MQATRGNNFARAFVGANEHRTFPFGQLIYPLIQLAQYSTVADPKTLVAIPVNGAIAGLITANNPHNFLNYQPQLLFDLAIIGVNTGCHLHHQITQTLGCIFRRIKINRQTQRRLGIKALKR